MGKKWTKAQHAKFSATMKKKRNGPTFDAVTAITLADLREDEARDRDRVASATARMLASPPSGVSILKKWDVEANMAFAALPFDKKAALLATLEKR